MNEQDFKRQLTHKLREQLSKDYNALYVKEYSTMWETERFLRKSELNIMSLDNSVELISKIIAEARADQNKKIGEWGNEPCPHRNNDFPFPKAVPTELQMLKRECRDCWQEKFGIAKLQKGEF